MKIYTGYLAQLKRYKKSELFPIAICGAVPDWFKEATYKKLAPHKDWFFKWKKEHLSIQWYCEKYESTVLNLLDKEKVRKELGQISGGKDIILLCYERPREFCHRHLVANWLGDVEEYPL